MMVKTTRTVGSLLVLLILAMLPALAIASEDASDVDDNSVMDTDHRNGKHFSFDRDLYSVRMRSHVSRGGISSSVGLGIEAKDGLSLRYSSGFEGSGWSEHFDMGGEVLGVVEYIDGNGNGVYDPLKDRVASTLPLSTRFHYLEFVRKDDTDPTGDENYRKGYGIGYEIGLRWGSHDMENGIDYSPNPREHLKEYFTAKDSNSAEERGEIGEFLRGLLSGYKAGYDEGYGVLIDDPVIEPGTGAYDDGTTSDGRQNDRPEEGTDRPEDPNLKPERPEDKKDRPEDPNEKPERPPEERPCPIPGERTYFKPLGVVVEEYDQGSYALAYKVVDRTGVFHAVIGIAGDLYGHGVVVPERMHVSLSIVDYPFQSRSGRLAVIAYTGASYGIKERMNAVNVTPSDISKDVSIPFSVIDRDGEDVPARVTTFEKHEYVWEDLHGKGWSCRYGIIINLPGWNDGDEEKGTDDTTDEPVSLTDGTGPVVEKGMNIPMAVTFGVIGATLLAMIALGTVGVIVFRKRRSVW